MILFGEWNGSGAFCLFIYLARKICCFANCIAIGTTLRAIKLLILPLPECELKAGKGRNKKEEMSVGGIPLHVSEKRERERCKRYEYTWKSAESFFLIWKKLQFFEFIGGLCIVTKLHDRKNVGIEM
jgi:hypothetical protein